MPAVQLLFSFSTNNIINFRMRSTTLIYNTKVRLLREMLDPARESKMPISLYSMWEGWLI